jgi:hypothetical protein
MPEFDSTIRYADCPGHPGYMVGSDGSVWSRWKKNKPKTLCDTWQPSRIFTNKRLGYLIVHLEARSTFYVHRLVLEAFVGPCPAGMLCRHFPDRGRANCCLANLSWGTQQENKADELIHGTRNHGHRNGQARFTAEQVLAIRAEFAAGGISMGQLGRKYKVRQSTIQKIIYRQRWKHI